MTSVMQCDVTLLPVGGVLPFALRVFLCSELSHDSYSLRLVALAVSALKSIEILHSVSRPVLRLTRL